MALDNDCCCMVFCDMSKAFDRVRHTLLIEKLAAVGCGGTVLRWLADYLTGRTQQVVINDARSSSKPCSRGVPQGSVLGPLLFSLYVRQVPRVFKYIGEQIEVVQQAKYLGIFIDEHLHFHHQVKYVVDSVLRKAGTFKHGRRNLTTEARRTFYTCQSARPL